MSESEFKKTKTFGILLSQIFQLALLFIAGVFVLWGALLEIYEVLSHRGPALKDILLLFIFIELGAMISIYFKTNKLSVRFLIYIAITALTRLLVVDIKAIAGLDQCEQCGAPGRTRRGASGATPLAAPRWREKKGAGETRFDDSLAVRSDTERSPAPQY